MEQLHGKWLVACSAGPDSMALVDMCIKQHIDIAIAHVNYHHRNQADIEEEYIRQYAKVHNIPLYVRNEPFIYKGNFEANARDWRYAFFVELVKEHGYHGVLVGHHQDDLIETFLMQEEKNIIPEYYGLKESIMYQGVLVKRPLLDYTKEQLENYCRTNQIQYFIDVTNQDTTLRRNHMRHEVISEMTPFQRELVLQEIRQKNAILQERVCRVKTYIDETKTDLEKYRKLSNDDRYALLRIVIDQHKKSHVSLAHIKEIDQIICSKNDFIIEVNDQWLVSDHTSFFMHEIVKTYEDTYGSITTLIGTKKQYYDIEKGECGVHALSLTDDDFPITIRNAKDRDYIMMRFGKKKVNRFFIDRKIPLYKRKYWPVVVNRHGDVIFVAGLGCDVAHFTVTPDINVVEY